MIRFLAETRKAIAAILGVAGLVVSAGLLHGQLLTVVNIGIAALTTLSVYAVPNTPKAAPVPTVFAPPPAPSTDPAPVFAPTPGTTPATTT